VRFILLPGHRFDTVGVAPLIKDIEFGGLIADKAFDSNWIIEDIDPRMRTPQGGRKEPPTRVSLEEA